MAYCSARPAPAWPSKNANMQRAIGPRDGPRNKHSLVASSSTASSSERSCSRSYTATSPLASRSTCVRTSGLYTAKLPLSHVLPAKLSRQRVSTDSGCTPSCSHRRYSAKRALVPSSKSRSQFRSFWAMQSR